MPGEIDLREPVFFQPNRVWRCYTGGLLLDRFLGNPEPADGHFPEEWIASTTLALNGPHQQNEDEGLSQTRFRDGSPGPLLRDLVLQKPGECLGPGATRAGVAEGGVGVLNKFLDSAVRLPIQCHPDRAFAREHYNSEHGKTEAWIVIGAREIAGEEPYLLMGFKPGTRHEAFAEAVREQDVPAMESMLHRLPARPGDAYVIPGRFPHAIGPGVFLLEIQEPTDWVVQPERWIGDTELSRSDMWGPLTPEVGLECFDYEGAGTLEEIEKRTRLVPAGRALSWCGPAPERLSEGEGARVERVTIERVIGPDATDCFGAERLTVSGEFTHRHGAPFHVGIVTAGSGEVETVSAAHPVRQGDTFFVSNRVESLRYRNTASDEKTPLTVYVVST